MTDDDRDLSDRSVADLLKQASDQTSTLVRQELELAKAELTTKGKQVGPRRRHVRRRRRIRRSTRSGR